MLKVKYIEVDFERPQNRVPDASLEDSQQAARWSSSQAISVAGLTTEVIAYTRGSVSGLPANPAGHHRILRQCLGGI
jgi:hypothetical protein